MQIHHLIFRRKVHILTTAIFFFFLSLKCLGAQSLEFQINTYTNLNQLNPAVAVLRDGGFVVVWSSNGQDGSWMGIYGQRYDTYGNRIGGEFQVNVTTAESQDWPIVAALSDGGFVVTWQSGEVGNNTLDVYAHRFGSSGNRVGGELRVNTYTIGNQSQPFVAALAGGGFVLVWDSTGQDGSFYGVYGQRYDSRGNK